LPQQRASAGALVPAVTVLVIDDVGQLVSDGTANPDKGRSASFCAPPLKRALRRLPAIGQLAFPEEIASRCTRPAGVCRICHACLPREIKRRLPKMERVVTDQQMAWPNTHKPLKNKRIMSAYSFNE
jgi:hypothetical protein